MTDSSNTSCNTSPKSEAHSTHFFAISAVSTGERVTVYTPTNDSDKKKAREPSHSPAKDYTKDGNSSIGGAGTPPAFPIAVPIVNQNMVVSAKRSFIVGPGTNDVDALPPPAKRGRLDSHTASSSSTSSATSAAGSKRNSLTPEAVQVLRDWMFSPEHIDSPYPTEAEKRELAARAGIKMKQLCNWFTNARKRLWQPLLRQRGDDVAAHISTARRNRGQDRNRDHGAATASISAVTGPKNTNFAGTGGFDADAARAAAVEATVNAAAAARAAEAQASGNRRRSRGAKHRRPMPLLPPALQLPHLAPMEAPSPAALRGSQALVCALRNGSVGTAWGAVVPPQPEARPAIELRACEGLLCLLQAQ